MTTPPKDWAIPPPPQSHVRTKSYEVCTCSCAMDAKEEIERLRSALSDVTSDVIAHEKANNLSPNPGRKYCWDSVARAVEILDGRMALIDLIAQATKRFNALTPQQQAQADHRYEQRRSFVRGMCPSHRNYEEWCKEVDRQLPPRQGASA